MRRLVLLLYFSVFVIMAVGALTFFWQTRTEYLRLKDIERATEERLLAAQERLQDQEETLRRLREDPAYVEMIIRRRLGYAKPDELLFRFEDQEME